MASLVNTPWMIGDTSRLKHRLSEPKGRLLEALTWVNGSSREFKRVGVFKAQWQIERKKGGEERASRVNSPKTPGVALEKSAEDKHQPRMQRD